MSGDKTTIFNKIITEFKFYHKGKLKRVTINIQSQLNKNNKKTLSNSGY